MILLVGGNGYIGSAIADMLASMGEEFRIFDNLSTSNPLNILIRSGNSSKLELRRSGVNRSGRSDRSRYSNFFWGDVRNLEELERAFEDVEVVFHLAAKLPVAPGMVDEGGAKDIEEVNYTGTLNVLELARKHDAKIVFASTCNVYGKGYNLSEESDVNPLNDYARSKLKAEKACLDYCDRYGLDVVILRLASVYGYSSGIRFNLVVNYFVLRALTGNYLPVFGDGSNYRPFVHVKDAAKAFVFFGLKDKMGKIRGEIYNIGAENLTIREVAETVRKIVNPVEIVFTGEKPEFSYHVSFGKSRAAGFEPEFMLKDGVRDLAAKLRSLEEEIG